MRESANIEKAVSLADNKEAPALELIVGGKKVETGTFVPKAGELSNQQFEEYERRMKLMVMGRGTITTSARISLSRQLQDVHRHWSGSRCSFPNLWSARTNSSLDPTWLPSQK